MFLLGSLRWFWKVGIAPGFYSEDIGNRNSLLSAGNSRVGIETEVSLPPKPESYMQSLLMRSLPQPQILWELFWTQIFLFLTMSQTSCLGTADIKKIRTL